MPLYGLGLGEMHVQSALGQPFLAEIELIDSNGVQLNNLKVVLADLANYEYLGLNQLPALSLLSFKVEKNKDGRIVVIIQSVDQITEPYMDLVVDLAWRGGQLYKAYNVLLDPPGYQLQSSRVQGSATYYKKAQQNEPTISQHANKPIASLTNVIKNSEKERTYGPTLLNESVWQLAQRYKTPTVKLPQVVLAIAGANPDAFDKGNLNNLKVGVQLKIPTNTQIQSIPVDKAEQEINAHDLAWNKKIDIQHVINPPYYVNNSAEQAKSQIFNSIIPTLPRFAQNAQGSEGAIPQLILKDFITPIGGLDNQVRPQTQERNASIKAEFSITTSAIESLKESNAVLKEKLNQLQDQNKKLQEQLEKRNKDIDYIREQIQVLMKQREAIAGQASKQLDTTPSSNWSWILLLLLAAGGGGGAYWYYNGYQKKNEEEFIPVEPTPVEPTPVEPTPVEPTPVEPTPVEPIPVEPIPVEPTPVEPTPVEPIPVEPIPVEPIPVKPVLIPVVKKEPNHVERGSDQTIENQFDPLVEYEMPIEETYENEIHPETPLEEEHMLEFETGLHELIKEQFDLTDAKVQEKEFVEEDNGLDFKTSPISTEFAPIEQELKEESTDELSDPLKSKQAFETLFDLAQTYISMDDVESARHALEEVKEHGTQLQKEKAQGLLLQIQDRKN